MPGGRDARPAIQNQERLSMIGNETTQPVGLLGIFGNLLSQGQTLATQGQQLLQTIKGGTPPVGQNASNQPATAEQQAMQSKRRNWIIVGALAVLALIGLLIWRNK